MFIYILKDQLLNIIINENKAKNNVKNCPNMF